VELPHFVKTSGSTGLHVLIPLGARYTHEQSRAMAELLANCVVRQLPEIATVARHLDARGGKVYVDYLQNGHGRLLVAPYSVRPVPRACVSMPLNWKQVTSKLDMFRYNLRTVPELLARQKTDPFGELMTEVADLNRSLRLLADVV
jgi:bifunctional non-homologous end joining protein LigD